MKLYDNKLVIKLWADEDRPRERLLLNGRRHLTDAELIAILINSGNKEESAVDLSKRILAGCESDLEVLGRMSVKELCKFKGIGEAKAICIVAALELGRRRKESQSKQPLKITTSEQAYQILLPQLEDLNCEEFWIILLNRGNFYLGKYLISKGGQAGTVVDPKIIFKTAMDNGAAYIILAHNHPSGNPKPSHQDVVLTKNLVQAGKMLDLHVCDHIIVTNKSCYSFNDEGLI